MAKLNVGIMGAGGIATCMATALNGLGGEVKAYAIASRSLEKAEAFAEKWHVEKAYGSYEDLAADPEVDLIYIATPHSEHYQNAKLCMSHGRNVLVEKSFTANVKQAEELMELAREKNVFLTEAIWTRYMPSRQIITDLMNSGIIGEVTEAEAELSAPISHIQRMYDPMLCGGALLDLGVYALTTASLYLGDDVVDTKSTCKIYKTGVDDTDEITLTYRDGKIAKLRCSITDRSRSEANLFGTKGRITWKNLTNPCDIEVYDLQGNLQKKVDLPEQINGYEYEVLACKEALEKGWKECPAMPHEETLVIMGQMDALRASWGVKYPFE